MKIERCSRSRSSRNRCGRGGGRCGKLRMVAGVLHALYGFFNLICNNGRETLKDVMFIVSTTISD
jgi:hypothetical protein